MVDFQLNVFNTLTKLLYSKFVQSGSWQWMGELGEGGFVGGGIVGGGMGEWGVVRPPGKQSPRGGKISRNINNLNENKKLIFYAQQILNC
jgi:hypothetical protein